MSIVRKKAMPYRFVLLLMLLTARRCQTSHLCYVHLLLGDVAPHVNHLHAVSQRLGNRVGDVSRADKQHLKQERTKTKYMYTNACSLSHKMGPIETYV